MRIAIRLTTLALFSLCMASHARAQDVSTPEGFWYLSSGGQRLEMRIDDFGGNWGGWIRDEGAPAANETIDHLEWYPHTRRLVLRTSGSGGLWRWYRLHIVEGVLKGRISQAGASPAQPAIANFTRHVTGWNATHLDVALAPRAFDVVLDEQHRARLRIDESSPGSGMYLGQMKVYASIDNGALDEGLQYDIHVSHWDGSVLQFHRGTTDDWQAFSGTVSGRHIAGHYFEAGTPEVRAWRGARAEVLGRGIGENPPAHELSAWQARLRSQLGLLGMARNPAPAGMTVEILQADLPPFPSVAMSPRRDDNPSAWPRGYRMDELGFEFELANPYGAGTLVRNAHGYLARPVSGAEVKRPAVLVLNGHGASARAMMDPDNPYYWYGEAFARRGYIVLALDVSHRTHGDDPGNGNLAHPAIAAPGFSTDWEEDGERTWTAMRAIDFLLSLPDVDPDQVVVAGLSMGGEVAGMVGAMDERVSATIVSGYSPDLAVIRHGDNHPCWEWQLADITEYVEMSDYQALVSPRLLVVQTGTIDPVFSSFEPPFAAAKQVARRAVPIHMSQGGMLIHPLHDRGHAFRVGDVAVDGEARPGLQIPKITGPTAPWDLEWQVDAQTSPLGMDLFELLGWADDSLDTVFSADFELPSP